MYFDRFDIAEAYWCYFADWHGGQASEEYRRLSGMRRYFRPRPGLSYDTLTENGRDIYDAVVAREQGRTGA
jgi:hypothetical protein